LFIPGVWAAPPDAQGPGLLTVRRVRIASPAGPSRFTGGLIVRLGHISDFHVGDRSRYPRHGITVAEVERYSMPRLGKLLAALEEAEVDHLLVTGDLTMSGETSELERARKLLAPWIEAGRVTLLPGNHDVWSRAAAEQYRFLRVLGVDGKGMKQPWRVYPHRVDLGDEVALVALDSARWGADPREAPGEIGLEQLGAARELVRDANRQGRAVVLAVHHHLVLPRDRVASDVYLERMPLVDADKLVRLIAELPVAAVLHGPRHTAFRLELPGKAGPVPVICAGSGSRANDEPARRPRAMIHGVDRGGIRSVDILVAAA
jgi:3',5'-cyclic AMP phosphodiesterase CpdA